MDDSTGTIVIGRELRPNIARYLELRMPAETITLTQGGRVDAQLGPVQTQQSDDGRTRPS